MPWRNNGEHMSETTQGIEQGNEPVRCDNKSLNKYCRCVKEQGHTGMHLGLLYGGEVTWQNDEHPVFIVPKCRAQFSPNGTVECTVFCDKPKGHKEAHTGKRGKYEYAWLGNGQELNSVRELEVMEPSQSQMERSKGITAAEYPEKLQPYDMNRAADMAGREDPARAQGPAEKFILRSIDVESIAKNLQNSMEQLQVRADDLLKENIALNRALIDERRKLSYSQQNYDIVCEDRQEREKQLEEAQFALKVRTTELADMNHLANIWCGVAYAIGIVFLIVMFAR